MTVAGQTITDDEISELLAFEGDLALHAAVDPFKMRALLTELQHRREAEAEPVGILVVDDDGVLRLSFYEGGPIVSEGAELYAASPASGLKAITDEMVWAAHDKLWDTRTAGQFAAVLDALRSALGEHP